MTALLVTVLAGLVVAGVLLAALHHHPRQETTMTLDDPNLPTRWTHEGLATPPDEVVDLTMDKGTCTVDGRHQHRWQLTAWRRTSLEKVTDVHVNVSATGAVVMSEGALEKLLVAAGFERAEQ